MNTKAILITQCLQNDFVKPIDNLSPLPNALHVGYSEARRLVGEKVNQGPVFTAIEWAYQAKDLEIIHIRDWHNANEPSQKEHLAQFGPHCLENTPGAEFIFAEAIDSSHSHEIVNASGLNDFVDTNLAEILEPYRDSPLHIGLIGVWTEAKITFLAYDLVTRYPNFKVAVCDALTASSSRSSHFMAIDQLQNILGVRVFSSLGAFTNFLNGTSPLSKKKLNDRIDKSKIKLSAELNLSAVDQQLLLYLFRDSKEVNCKVLDGGFSGNVVLRATALDMHGHKQVPCVVKIGERDLIAKERTSFERIQEVLGNHAPSIVDFADVEERGAIKYRYASMSDDQVLSFQKYFSQTENVESIKQQLDIVFKQQLGKLYEVAKLERGNILEYYWFSSKFAESVAQKAKEITGQGGNETKLQLSSKVSVDNIVNFYAQDVDKLLPLAQGSFYKAFVHGDLNGANILIDGHQNTWLIDFFHTHRGHVLRDLIKLENDILYIFTQIDTEEDFHTAIELSDKIMAVDDLADGLPELKGDAFEGKKSFQKTYEVIAHLRSLYGPLIATNRNPLQYFVAALRYSVHNLSFEESSLWQRKWALFSSSLLCQKIKSMLLATNELRVDFIETQDIDASVSGRLGLTILPGRRDKNRHLVDDLAAIKRANIDKVYCLISADEFSEYGVPNLLEEYQKAGIDATHFAILDQKTPSEGALRPVIQEINSLLQSGKAILLHCVGGLGRSGLVAACSLKTLFALSAKDAISLVRKYRSDRAVETKGQEKFVADFFIK